MRSFLIGFYVFVGGFLFPIHKDKKLNHFSKSHEKLQKIGKLDHTLLPECSGICYTKNQPICVKAPPI